MEVVLGGNLINVSIVRKNNKNVYFRFKDDELVVTANRLVSEAKIEKLIMENEKSLLRMYNHVIKKSERDLQFCYLEFHRFLIFHYTLDNFLCGKICFIRY